MNEQELSEAQRLLRDREMLMRMRKRADEPNRSIRIQTGSAFNSPFWNADEREQYDLAFVTVQVGEHPRLAALIRAEVERQLPEIDARLKQLGVEP